MPHPDKARLYELLENQRVLVIDKNTGGRTRGDAWAVIDLLLDNLIELNTLDVNYEPHESGY